MKILSYGDCINKGKFRIHSIFTNVHNYYNQTGMVSLVSTRVGRGPNNIAVTELPEAAGSIEILKNSLVCNCKELQFNKNNLYFSFLTAYIEDRTMLLNQIDYLITELQADFKHKGLSYLLYPAVNNEDFNKFERTVYETVKAAVAAQSSLVSLTQKMKGIGKGLTPSGDDFNCGLLYALAYLEKSGLKTTKNISRKCYRAALGRNKISNNFLKYAYLGAFYEDFKNLLRAMALNNREQMKIYGKKVLAMGHSSGADLLTGFFITIKGVMDANRYN